MDYTIQQLIGDVMGRVGEMAEASASAIPGPAEVIALKVGSLLPEVGERLLRESPLAMLGDGVPIEAAATSRLMPCGLYAAEVGLPEEVVRCVSAKMAGWERSVEHIIYIGDGEWGCQWSEEVGIAGGPRRPRGYMAAGAGGRILRLIGSEGAGDSLEWLRGWRIPRGESFGFPSALYPVLVTEISSCL